MFYFQTYHQIPLQKKNQCLQCLLWINFWFWFYLSKLANLDIYYSGKRKNMQIPQIRQTFFLLSSWYVLTELVLIPVRAKTINNNDHIVDKSWNTQCEGVMCLRIFKHNFADFWWAIWIFWGMFLWLTDRHCWRT